MPGLNKFSSISTDTNFQIWYRYQHYGLPWVESIRLSRQNRFSRQNFWSIIPELKNIWVTIEAKFFWRGIMMVQYTLTYKILLHYRGICLLDRVYWTSNNGSKTIIEAFWGCYSIICHSLGQERFSYDRSQHPMIDWGIFTIEAFFLDNRSVFFEPLFFVQYTWLKNKMPR